VHFRSVILLMIRGVCNFLNYAIQQSQEMLLISNGKQHLKALNKVDIMMPWLRL
jgi:hypothetical protein